MTKDSKEKGVFVCWRAAAGWEGLALPAAKTHRKIPLT